MFSLFISDSRLPQRLTTMTDPSHIHRVTSLAVNELKPYLTLRRPEDHWKQGIFVAEGEKVVRRLIASRLTIVSFLLTREWHERLVQEGLLEAYGDTQIFIAEMPLLRQIVGYRLHQCLLAVARVPPEPSHDMLPEPHLLFAIDGLVLSENVGVIVRNCAAFGVDAMLVGENASSPYLRRSVRNSMGTLFGLRVMHPRSLVADLNRLHHERGTRIIGTDAAAGQSVTKANLGGNLCLVVGNEEAGISVEVRAVCDEFVSIPMWNAVDSVNVASATGIVLYEARRQRTPQ
jgi:tRNA G18 (ribose-2'-O)-methylase SpoU